MEQFWIRYFIFSCVFTACAETTTINGTKDLLTTLFTTKTYNKKIRPLQDQTQVLNISITFELSAITQFDEQEESLTTAGYLRVEWTDEQLTWTREDHSYIGNIIIPQDDIWKPDISLRNSFNSFKGLGASYFNAWIENDGTVKWDPFQVLKSTCSVDITYFPYDTQSCTLKFTVWSYTNNEVNFLPSIGIQKSEYSESSTWTFVSSSASVDNSYIPSVTYTLYLSRKPLFYVLNMIFPVILLSILNIFTFTLPVKSGERASYSVTLFLSLSVFLTIIASEFPKNSDALSYLALYLILMTTTSTWFVFVSVLQIRLLNKEDDKEVVGRFYKSLYNIVQVLRCKKCKKCNRKVGEIHENTSEDMVGSGESEEEVTWSGVVDAIDFICFWLGSIVIFVVTLTLMLILIYNPQRRV